MADSRQIIIQNLAVEGEDGTLPKVNSQTYKSLDRLGKALGLGGKAAVKSWTASEAFLPDYNELYEAVIKHRVNQGPLLDVVQKAMFHGETYGDRKYSRARIDKSSFNDVNHYALCLYRLREENAKGRDGCFKKYNLTDGDMELRLWQAILRATWDRAPARKDKKSKKHALVKKAQENARKASKTMEGESAAKRTDTEAEDDDEDDEDEEIQATDLRGTTTDDTITTSPTASPSASPAVPPTASPSTSPTASPTASPAAVPAALPDDSTAKGLSDLDRMRLERDRVNPFNLNTPYGRYLTIYTVSRNFKNSFILQRLIDAHKRQHTQEVYDESEDWHDVLETNAAEKRFEIRKPSQMERSQKEEIERWFDNPAYQPLNYLEACQQLHISNLMKPCIPGMSRSLELRSWQVTGISALIRFRMSESIRACVLADATGLGKTFQVLGYFLYVSYRRLPTSSPLTQL
jgi:SNF2 family DNA or RNA helicase